jgi:hypothetical protein
MPIELLSNIAQKNRAANVSSTAFFYLLDSSNIDYRIKAIQENANLNPLGDPVGSKYIIRNPLALHVNFGTIANVGENDIIIKNQSNYSIYVDVSNSSTNQGGVVYNDSDDKLYYYNGTIWRSLGLGSLVGTINQISVTGTTGDVKIGLTPIVIIENYIQTPELKFSNGITMGGVGQDIQITGNLNITGNLLVDGQVVTKTAFRGDASDQEIETITDVELDAGDY